MAKLNKLQVSFISLVDKPANKRDIVYKCRDKFTDEKLIKVAKASDQGLVKGTVYEPNVKDTDGDWADAETIQKAAHDFLIGGKNFNVDTDHSENKIGAAVVESHINEKGAWEVTLKMDPESETFQKVKKGEYKGLSMMALTQKSEEEPPNNPDDISSLKELVAKQQKAIEELQADLKGIPKTRQLVIDEGGNVSVSKGANDSADGVLQEFDFANLK